MAMDDGYERSMKSGSYYGSKSGKSMGYGSSWSASQSGKSVNGKDKYGGSRTGSHDISKRMGTGHEGKGMKYKSGGSYH